MATIDVSCHRAHLLADQNLLSQLPPELLQIICSHDPTNFLDAVAAAALIPQCTSHIFVYFESAFADVAARWLIRPRLEGQDDRIIASFARILPFAPYLAVFLEQYLAETSLIAEPSVQKFKINSLDASNLLDLRSESLVPTLLALWRLLNFDRKTFRQLIQPSQMQMLFLHSQPSVRYLAIRVFCQLLAASDLKLEALIQEYIESADGQVSGTAEKRVDENNAQGKSFLMDDFDGQQLDFTFLSLLEQQRAKEIDSLRQELKSVSEDISVETVPSQNLTSLVTRHGVTLLPRPRGPPSVSSALVLSPTTVTNLEHLSQALHQSGPILLHGLPGSGKTSAVQEMARELGMNSGMVTLHINEQTDAKMLIGLYSTDSRPGSFSWRPGVLTTAVKEGRWVLIEDLDRAPNEVMSTLLPLVERGELLIPSRGERIRAPSRFRLFATVRTSRGMNGQESLPALLGQRFWQSVAIKMPPPAELQDIILGTYPLLQKFVPDIISVFKRLCTLPHRSLGGRSIADRPITPRDLLKWCRRLNKLLLASGSKTGAEPISETTRDWMFMEAVDCFCGSIPNQDSKSALVAIIAQEMRLPPQLADFYLQSHVPRLEDSSHALCVGRVTLNKRHHAYRVIKSKKPFASTSHAKRLLEQIAVAVELREPTLLVGETGIGKTTVVQQLADTLGHKLVAVNLSQQSEVGDLLGGFKPLNARNLAIPLKEEFEDLFSSTGISASKNQRYLEQIGKCLAKGQWTRVLKLWREAPKMFNKILNDLQVPSRTGNGDAEDRPPVKRRKTESKLQSLLDLKPRWDIFAKKLDQFEIQISSGSGSFAFAFVEGNIVKAARNGDWVLLDEINLASPDTLESIADLLASGPNDEPSILLSETGEIERVKAHPDFRIFGAMNPATDIGKRDLPVGLRSRFTELYVSSPDRDIKDLLTIIKAYLKGNSAKDDQAADDIARLYLKTKEMTDQKRLVDGANEVPHFSLRTLTRVLSYVNEIVPFYGLRRSLYEGFSMGFLTLLSKDSEDLLVPEIHRYLLDRHGHAGSLLSQPPRHPNDGKQYVKFQSNSGKKDERRAYWLLQGDETPQERDDYIVTKSVERNLLNLVRATSTRQFPVLIQGPTSAGKTSMIEYLANFSGNKFVRINNHEHTDLQEYLGTYVSGADGKLRFQEGLLVQALRQGHWIVLDELNLAPTDVLEALNRLLDDNRELLIPETQEVVRPHENFMLFATQNPPGLYGGRKVLSRAFRNRFLELHFDDIPEDELQTILQKRSVHTSPPDCERIVKVYRELSRLRQTTRLFENKDSFATLRDLFRWALRGAAIRVPTTPGADQRQEIANHGFMLLAERVRNEDERLAVKKVIETVFKVRIDPDQLYDAQLAPYLVRFRSAENSQGVVWTNAMRRLYVLVGQALANDEPVLLVGETGCGKTTVCQLLAEALGKELHIVNAHQNTETGDLIGSQRPVRNRGFVIDALRQDLSQAFAQLDQPHEDEVDTLLQRYHALDAAALSSIEAKLQQRIAANEVKSKALFEWADGNLVHAMKHGQFFLLDEISLADDSVLERLNSVLEPSRTLLLAEKGIDNSFVKAAPGFQFFATMNPGGDFGKKELSPALRNRFTEIWVPALSNADDVLQIVNSKLKPGLQNFADVIVKFSYWFGRNFRATTSTAFSIRDILVWTKFVNEARSISPVAAVVHGAATVFIDTLGANPSALIALDPRSMDSQRQKCLDKLTELVGQDTTAIYRARLDLTVQADQLKIGEFAIARAISEDFGTGFALDAPTTKMNAMRVIRALQVQKPILLEGSPGVGKTTLISALARACGQPLTRINLSDQTDLMDLFGTDVPVEGEEAGHFAWRDAPFLRAMQNGEWVLLDEMNLASQSVLEGLNACLDHRGEVYISELDQTFKRHPNFRLFAAQNPHHQGGGRKGLPSSFVNRFIVVYADVFSEDDLLLIAQHTSPEIPAKTVKQLIRFISRLDEEVAVKRSFGAQGAPWEFNLRDTLRWLELLRTSDALLATGTVDDFLGVIIRQRFRSKIDRQKVDELFTEAFGCAPRQHQLYHNRSSSLFQVGLALMHRDALVQACAYPCINEVVRLPEIESVLICIKQNLPCILVGPSGSGKSVLLEHVASLTGKPLVVFPMNADIDTMDLVGGFEQHDPLREVNVALRELQESLQRSISEVLPQLAPRPAVDLLNRLENRCEEDNDSLYLLGRIRELQSQVPSESELARLLSQAESLLGRSNGIKDPTFEWLDGIIVQALQKGHWLVLDNANLCNASVLDRLNSLLEPDGFLIINEHCGPNGKPVIVKPHPDFRIFLTMDPRYGELSRAMRNRAIEIHLDSQEFAQPSYIRRVGQVEAALSRYELLSSAMALKGSEDVQFSHLAGNALSLPDTTLFSQFQDTFNLKPSDTQALEHLATFLGSDGQANTRVRNTVRGQYAMLAQSVAPSFRDMQPLQPLLNSTVLPILQRTVAESPFWLATCFEFCLELIKAQQSLESRYRQALVTQPSEMTRLQRSCVADSVAAVSKDSTVGAARFLKGFLDAVEAHIYSGSSSQLSWQNQRHILKMLLHYWWRTFQLLDQNEELGDRFDEARFQAHLRQGTELMTTYVSHSNSTASSGLVSYLLNGLQESFVTGFKLTTGLSMEPLWRAWRPLPILDHKMSLAVRDIEGIAQRFDALKWEAAASLEDLTQVTDSLAKAYRVVRENADNYEELVRNVSLEITKLERSPESRSKITPIFTTEFDMLRQLTLLSSLVSQSEPSLGLDDITVLSGLPTIVVMRMQSATPTSRLLQSMDYLMGAGVFQPSNDDSPQYTHPWTESLSTSVVIRLDSIDSQNLRSLQMLETELPLLAKRVAISSESITGDQLSNLGGVLLCLLRDASTALGPEFSSVISRLQETLAMESPTKAIEFTTNGISFESSELSESPPSNEIVIQHLVPALLSVWASTEGNKPRRAFLANAWLQFAIAMMKLYIPDKVFDPQLRPLVDLQSYDEQLKGLERQSLSQQRFDLFFTGQSTSLLGQLIEEDITTLGSRPADVQSVYRPEGTARNTALRELQGQFNGVLKTILGSDVSSAFFQHCFGSEVATQQLQVLRQNVAQMLSRLSSTASANFEDLRAPLVNILHCFDIGLSLSEGASAQRVEVDEVPDGLLDLVPFMGGSINSPFPQQKITGGFDILAYVSSLVSVEGLKAVDPTILRVVFQTLNSFYTQWKQKLESDRKGEEQRKSMYRYRGGFDDVEQADQEDFDNLFPNYDENDDRHDSSSKPRVSDARGLAIQLAQVHKGIFLSPEDAPTSLKALSQRAIRRICANDKRQVSDRKLLSAALFQLDNKLGELTSAVTSAAYNFYTDANLPEARKLVALIHDIRGRFRQLQQIDEIGHMQPLEDVIVACDKVLDHGHSEPLAKIITSVEKLHAFVYEWQFGGWASRVHAVLPLYNKLTEILVSWRRLELSTWGKLFDLEMRKCEDDANSWWFIAYQAVIAGPLALARSGEDLQDHAVNLLTELETYFSSASVGQFTTRLNLLRQLKQQLDMMTVDWPSMSIIRDSILNFISFYAHFEKVAEETIKTGRHPIEKQMKDVLLLASWKDTNIVALRESAHKSHLKLFKLVKKFREVLAQPMKAIIENGLPDETHADPVNDQYLSNPSQINETALALCQNGVSDWMASYKRLANVQRTVSIMGKMGQIPSSSVDAADSIQTFLAELESSATELRKETPAFLTDEIKNLVKHLKSRKRKLFAEVLRDLREMGLKHNLSLGALAKQDSLSTILSQLQAVTSDHNISTLSADYYFHRMLDLAPRFRNANQTHSDDLTGAEVSRSIGFLEGILQAVIAQRRTLALELGKLDTLHTFTKEVQTLAQSKNDSFVHRHKRSNIQRVSPWISQILKVAVQLIEVHGKLGGLDNGSTLEKMNGWLGRLMPYVDNQKLIDTLPGVLTSASSLRTEDELNVHLRQLYTDLAAESIARPDLAFILEGVQLWTSVHDAPIDPSVATGIPQEMLLNPIKHLTDSILVAVELFNKAAVNLPGSTEQVRWLMQYDETMAASIQALHIDKITESIEGMLRAFTEVNLEDAKCNELAISLMAVVWPIIEQYYSTCHAAILTYARFNNQTSKMGFKLSKSFIQLAGQGFCTPQEKSDEKSKESGKLEGGTGLGDGEGAEGAEDISKDIQPDEDLSELAQEKNKESGEQEIEDEKDAVDMADQDLEGEMGSVNRDDQDDSGSKSGDEEDGENEMDEEAGTVDDLDPTAVDEKMWDGDNEDEADKDQQGDKSNGQQKKDEQMAADEKPDNKDAQPEENMDASGDENKEDEELGVEQDEDVQFDEMNRQDQNVEEQDNLALPDDMQIDGKDDESMSSISDDDLDKLSDVQEEDTEEHAKDSDRESATGEEADMTAPAEDTKQESDLEESEQGVENANIQQEEDMDVVPEEEQAEDHEKVEMQTTDDGMTSADNVAPSDVRNGGQDANADENEQQDQDGSHENAAQREDGQMGENSADQDTASGEKGSISKSEEQQAQGDMEDLQDSAIEHPFKALGDALEKWHRRQREIKEAQTEESTSRQDKTDMTEQEMASREFQHLQNDETAADTQAIGTATEDEARPFDDAMAIDDEEQAPDSRVMPEDGPPADEDGDNQDKMDISEPTQPRDKQEAQNEESRTGVSTRKGAYDRDDSPPAEGVEREEQDEERVEETSAQLSSTHLEEPDHGLRDFNEAMQLWTSFQTKTSPLSLSLTSQLRLILTPSQSTKLSGSYRTGKRLNIKRIIPYIASGYKRDKIWMRRAIPTKRAYQILLCVDDSKSMGESDSGTLALESLVMVSRALTMLEVGQIGVLGFGGTTFMAHEFAEPFASYDAGAKALQHFTFRQDYTDIRMLIRETIARFRTARLQNPARAGAEDLWQLSLILSDGLTPSDQHDEIRRLLREAMEERIMVVFIIMDDTSNQKDRKDSVLNLRKARFVKDEQGNNVGVKMDYYLDGFPFQYYLIVHDLEDLPGALAGLLRTWFAEVNS